MDGLTPETLAARQDSTIFLLMLVKILMKLLLLLCTCYNGQTSVAFWLIGVDVNTAERTNVKVHWSIVVAKKSFKLREKWCLMAQ